MISAIVITKNEEQLISNCLESLKWADELIVIDNGSTDQTVAKAKKFTSLIFSYLEEHDFAGLRNFAITKAKGDWLLFVDSDERVTKALRSEVKELVSSDKYSAYALSRRNFIFGEEKRYKAFWPDRVMRLIKKDRCQGFVGKVHEYPQIEGEIGYSKNSLFHLTHRNLDQVMLKSLDWSKIDAKLRLDAKHPEIKGWRLLRILITETFNQGIIRGGFFAGTVGIIDSLLQTFSMVMTYIRLWEMQQSPPLDERYQALDKKLHDQDFDI